MHVGGIQSRAQLVSGVAGVSRREEDVICEIANFILVDFPLLGTCFVWF